jgi:putative transferase (TIGR04331 family)
MNKKCYLITTADERTWKFDGQVIFLGEWCRIYNRKHIWSNMNGHTIPWQGSNRIKIKKDYIYLNSLYEKVLTNLTHELNNVHKTNHSLRYWRIIIGPWLLTYIGALWDRWESIRLFGDSNVECETIVPNLDFRTLVSDDYTHALKLISESDIWNYFIYSEILKVQNHKSIRLIKVDIAFDNKHDVSAKKSHSLIYHFAMGVDKFISKIVKTKTHNFVLYRTYFPNKFLIKLFYKLGQIPRLYSEFNTKMNNNANNFFIRPKIVKEQVANSFEQFLFTRVFKDMPKIYLEGYKMLSAYCMSLSNAQVIFTANAHLDNEVFKTWSAKQVDNGAQLIIGQHGGSIIPLMSMFEHEEKICDKKTVWHIEYDKNYTKLTPNKLFKKKLNDNHGDQIILVGLEVTRYSYRIESGISSSLNIDHFNQTVDLINLLDKKTRALFKVKPYSNMGCFTKDRYSNLYGKEIISNKKTLFQNYERSRLIICTYPSTTFSEAMHSGIPTILLYQKEFWELQPVFDNLVIELMKANIIHTDPVKAAKHINTISGNPKIWWDKEETKKARNMFFHLCGTINDDPLSEWFNFFKSTLSK